LLLIYGLAWTVLPAVLAPSFPLDVVEGIAWGHEWQWGYYKHPPLPAWLLYPAYQGLGRFGPYLLSQLSILLALSYVYRLSRQWLDAPRAALAAALPYAIYYYGWPTLEFNHNIAQIPVWAALAWHAQNAALRQRGRDWVWLGAWAGVAVLTKYSTGVLLLCLAVFFLLKPQRGLWRGVGPWLALGVATAVAAPHLLWLWHHDALPLTYLAARSQQTDSLAALQSALAFVGAQVLAHVPLLLVALLAGVRVWDWRVRQLPAEGRTWLLTVSVAPAVLTVGVALLGGATLHDMWGTPMWNFSGLLLLAGLPAMTQRQSRTLWRGLGVWMVLITTLMSAYLALGQSWRGRASRMDWPSRAMTQQAQHTWRALSSCPLRVVAGESWEAAQAAIGQVPMASILIAGDPRFSPWITSDRLQHQGALLVWRQTVLDQEAPVVGELPAAPAPGWQIAEGQWTLAWPLDARQAPLQMGWRAYVPPACRR